jgi:hypothetical protein
LQLIDIGRHQDVQAGRRRIRVHSAQQQGDLLNFLHGSGQQALLLRAGQSAHLTGNREPLVVVPLQQWSKLAQNALCAALAISNDVQGLLVTDEQTSEGLRQVWNRNVVEPAQQAHSAVPKLVVLPSPFRFVVYPIVDYVIKLSNENPDRRVIAIVPELVEHRWYNYFLHSRRATILKALLLMKGNDRISVLNIPWYFK